MEELNKVIIFKEDTPPSSHEEKVLKTPEIKIEYVENQSKSRQ